MQDYIPIVQAKITWKWVKTRHGKYVAICPALGQTVQAETFGDLVESMNEALDSTMRELMDSGNLNHFLKERGWKAVMPEQRHKPHQRVRFDVPYGLKHVRERDLQEALC
jgi:predicted RNase H-like HicB family nuclease